MSKRSIITIIAVIVVLIPFTGFPGVYKDWTETIAGLLIIAMVYLF